MTIGIICGLYAEARIADRLSGALVACTGGREKRARALIGFMLEKRISRLVSFGVATGLISDVVAGDLLLGATVMSEKGAWECDEEWNARLLDELPCYQCAPIWGSDTILKTAQEKAAVSVRSGCLAADMESHIVARAAAEARIPFNVVRAVADTALMDLPPAALVPLKEDGRIDRRAVLKSVINQTSQLPALVKLGHHTGSAFRALRQAVDIIGEIGP